MGRKKSRFYKKASEGTGNVAVHPVKVDPLLDTSKSSGKREREFEKYAAKKLKKEERPALFQRLQELAFSSTHLCSSRQLGRKDARESIKLEKKVDHIDSAFPAGPTSYEQLHGKEPLKVFSVTKNSLSASQDVDSSDSEEEEKVPVVAAVEEKNTASCDTKKAFYVLVKRPDEIETERAKLPIYAEEQAIIELIRENPVCMICGETGSGKTTQVPQFLFEAGYGDPASEHPGLVGITQPRRVAAVSMAARVQHELGVLTADGKAVVAHQVRFDSQVSSGTRIKFMTDGILLRELATDFLLQKYSVIILDEAHERNLNTDILLGMLSRVVRLRNEMALIGEANGKGGRVRPLRLVIMSATLDVEALSGGTRLFSPAPPVLRVEARQHPVAIHFSRRTNLDHIDAAFKVICKIHGNLPAGGILVFLTGKQDIVELGHRLARKYPTGLKKTFRDEADANLPDEQGEAISADADRCEVEPEANEDGEVDWSGSEFELDSEAVGMGLHVLPLHALLPPALQARVFQPAPEGSRLCVLATNLAETSITIPGIKYVVDSGRVKQRTYCSATGTHRFEVVWASKASAAQRSGRAGRTGPGHCYRLFSGAVFDQRCPEHAQPEILRSPVEALVLRLRSMGIDSPQAFPLPSQPDADAFDAAQSLLRRLGALDAEASGKVTQLGALMTDVPLAPRWARIVILAGQDCADGRLSPAALALALAMCACLAVGEASVLGTSALRSFAGSPATSDVLAQLSAFLSFLSPASDQLAFCSQYGLLQRRLDETLMQYRQLVQLMPQLMPSLPDIPALPGTLDRKTRDYLRQALCEALTDRIAERVRIKAPHPAYRLLAAAEPTDPVEEGKLPSNVVLLHADSCLRQCPPRFIVFNEAIVDQKGITSARHTTAIDQAWIPEDLLLIQQQ